MVGHTIFNSVGLRVLMFAGIILVCGGSHLQPSRIHADRHARVCQCNFFSRSDQSQRKYAAETKKSLHEINKKLDDLKSCKRPSPVVLGKSCKDILDREHHRNLNDGVYTIDVGGRKTKVYCDMTRDGGGWTLSTATRTSYGWTTDTVYERNIASPSLNHDYSILRLADSIKKNANATTFEYRIEANGRGHWGGIWQAPVSYTFTSTSDAQTDVKLTKMFDKWSYVTKGIEKHMPWISMKNANSLLTTNKKGDGHWWGTLMMKTTTSDSHRTAFNLGPWIAHKAPKANEVYYWLREN